MTTNDALTLKPSDITSPSGFIGRSSTAAGQQFPGRIKDFRVYSTVLTTEQVRALSDAAAPGNLQEIVDGGRPRRHDGGHGATSRCRPRPA